MKKILITGGAGYIGSVLVRDLLARKYQVRVIDRFMFGGESLLSFIENPSLEIIRADIRDKKIVKEAVRGVDGVVHLAALVGDPACKVDEKVTKEINVNATENLVDASKAAGVRSFLFASTCSNYGVTSVKNLATEESSLNPLSLYAETKIQAEQYVLNCSEIFFNPIVFRFATIFGLSPRMRFNLLLNEFARETALGGKLSIRNKKAFRPYLHVADASAAICTMLERRFLGNTGVFNIVGENIQKDYLAKIAKEINKNVKLTIEKGRLDDKRDYAVSAEKFTRLTGWEPKINVRQGFRSLIDSVSGGIFKDPYEPRYNDWIDDDVLKDKFKI